MPHYKYVRAFEENQPDSFLIYEGQRTFAADPICRCEEEAQAKRIVEAMNRLYAHELMRDGCLAPVKEAL